MRLLDTGLFSDILTNLFAQSCWLRLMVGVLRARTVDLAIGASPKDIASVAAQLSVLALLLRYHGSVLG